MKWFILSLLLFSTTAGYTISLSGRVKIILSDCRDPNHFFGTNNVEIISLAEDSSHISISTNHLGHTSEIALPFGKYIVIARNLYHQKVDTVVEVNDTALNNISICSDRARSYPKNSLAELKEEESITLYYSSDGCFHSFSRKLCIRKINGTLVAELYNRTKLKGKFIDGKLLVKANMSPEAVQAFYRLENELPLFKDIFGGCTTSDEYTIESCEGTLVIVDGTCRWHGFRYLSLATFTELFKPVKNSLD